MTDIILEPASISIEKVAAHRAVIRVGPLERGLGHTLGNALRRMLLSSLSGTAVVKAYIDGVLHKYDTIEGVQEDVLDILLNLKGAAFILAEGQDSAMLTLEKTGAGPIRLGDIALPSTVKLVNPDHVIATLTKSRKFIMDLKLARGRGEQLSEEYRKREEENKELNGGNESDAKKADGAALYLDAVFSPVRAANYTVERARKDQDTDLDKLIIELETNGAIAPEEAIAQANAILTDQHQVFAGLKKIEASELSVSPDHGDTPSELDVPVDPNLLLPISTTTLGINQRLCNSLKLSDIHFIGDLVTKTKSELQKVNSLGPKSIDEIEKVLKSHGLLLGMEIPNWPPKGLKLENI